jgi:two-component system chemotaxis sensor kinase CheA
LKAAAEENSEYSALLEIFAEESKDHLDSIVGLLVGINIKSVDPASIHSLFRSIHTIKGTSRSLGLHEIGVLSHAAEDLLDAIREQRVNLLPEMVDQLLRMTDILTQMIALALDRKPLSVKQGEVDQAVSILQSFMASAVARSSTQDLEAAPANAAFGFFDDEEKAPPPPPPSSPPETSTESGGSRQEQSIRIRREKIEDYVNLVSELMIARNTLLHSMRSDFREIENLKNLKQSALTIDRLTKEIHQNAMGMRMVPVRSIFQRAPRIVRDVGRSLGKEIELITRGDDVEIDWQVAEGLTDPLLHLIRNCVDHGIEPPEERRRQGKRAEGQILLRALQKGGSIWIEVEDDGQGINCERLKKKALEKGLITVAESESMVDDEAMQLIFRQGLSTAATVSDISGRGVGMDVVKSNVMKLGGQVNVQSRLHAGTTIRIELPLSLSVMNALIVESQTQVYAFPSDAIQEVVKIQVSAIHDVQGVPTVVLRDLMIPCFDIAGLEGDTSVARDGKQLADVVVMQTAAGKFGVLVDRLQNRQEIVVKPLPKALAASDCFGGAAILGFGSVVLVIDPSGLCQTLQGATQSAAI